MRDGTLTYFQYDVKLKVHMKMGNYSHVLKENSQSQVTDCISKQDSKAHSNGEKTCHAFLNQG